MSTLFLAFANDAKNYLNTLRDEDKGVNASLNERKLRGDFIVHSEQFATTDSIIKGLRQFKETIEVFLFSGHAGRDALALEDGEAYADGIAALLGRCPNLKLVILNGCSTRGQVEALQNLDIPMVIATNAPINDERATQFSITFFEELATKRQSVRAAFDAAIDAAKVKGHIDFEIRSRAAGRRDDIKASSWGLYYQDAHADLMNIWRLPEKPRASNTNQYLKNAIDLIYEQFETALKMQGEESRGQDVILKRLPYSISEPIRKLLAPSDNSGQLFYDRPSSERFQMLLYAYKSIVDFVTYVLLAQLWEQKRLPQNALNTEGVVEVLKTWLNKPTHQETEQSPLPFLLELMTFLKDNKVLFFLEELNQVRVELNNADVKDAVVFLEKQIRENPKAQLNYLCDETEQHLAVVLHQFGFLVNYGLTSVKDINVLFYQHNDVPNFEHKIVKLQQALTDLEDRTETEAYHYKTATILLRRFDDKSKFLYLSPFLIDENAYTHSLKAKLCAFVSYNSMTRQFNFSHISKPKDIILIEQKKTNIMTRIKGNTDANDTYFTLINGQFSAFCKAVLGKTLDEL